MQKYARIIALLFMFGVAPVVTNAYPLGSLKEGLASILSDLSYLNIGGDTATASVTTSQISTEAPIRVQAASTDIDILNDDRGDGHREQRVHALFTLKITSGQNDVVFGQDAFNISVERNGISGGVNVAPVMQVTAPDRLVTGNGMFKIRAGESAIVRVTSEFRNVTPNGVFNKGLYRVVLNSLTATVNEVKIVLPLRDIPGMSTDYISVDGTDSTPKQTFDISNITYSQNVKVNDTVAINFRVKNNSTATSTQLVSVGDDHGWGSQALQIFAPGEVKDVTYTLYARDVHATYNPHHFSVTVGTVASASFSFDVGPARTATPTPVSVATTTPIFKVISSSIDAVIVDQIQTSRVRSTFDVKIEAGSEDMIIKRSPLPFEVYPVVNGKMMGAFLATSTLVQTITGTEPVTCANCAFMIRAGTQAVVRIYTEYSNRNAAGLSLPTGMYASALYRINWVYASNKNVQYSAYMTDQTSYIAIAHGLDPSPSPSSTVRPAAAASLSPVSYAYEVTLADVYDGIKQVLSIYASVL